MSALSDVLPKNKELIAECESTTTTTTTTSASKEDSQNIPPGCIVCAWCSKVGIKLFTLSTSTGCKAFCSELCFTQCRRASFKKNKICDWCKHVRHTVNYVDFQDGEQQLQFCSNKCLNQFKMNIFCNEAKAHLHPNLIKESAQLTPKTSNLITPELWLRDSKNSESDFNSVNSYKGSSDSELDLELDDSSQSMTGPTNKRKFTDVSKDEEESKNNDKHKDQNLIKETKRLKHSIKLVNSRHTSGGKHSKHSSQDMVQQSEWSSREVKAEASNYPSSYRVQGRHSPIPTSSQPIRQSVVEVNHNIPLLNGSSPAMRTSVPLTPLAVNGSPPTQLFPRLPGSITSLRGTQILPSQPFGPRVPPLPNHPLSAAQMEALARMHSSFGGLRPPLPPFGVPPAPGLPFPGLPHLNGILPNGSPLLPPSLHQSLSLLSQFYQNNSLLPPMAVMAPYPVPIPIPIPIPIPLLFPTDKKSFARDLSRNSNDNNHQVPNQSSEDDVSTTSHNASTNVSHSRKIESVISKLKNKANENQNNISFVDQNLDLRRITAIDKTSDESDSDEEQQCSPKNLVIKTR